MQKKVLRLDGLYKFAIKDKEVCRAQDVDFYVFF